MKPEIKIDTIYGILTNNLLFIHFDTPDHVYGTLYQMILLNPIHLMYSKGN